MLVPTRNHGLVKELLSLWEIIWPFCFLKVCLFKVEICFQGLDRGHTRIKQYGQSNTQTGS